MIVGGSAAGALALRDDAQSMLDSLPGTARKMAQAAGIGPGARNGAIGKVEEAAKELEKAVQPAPERGVQRVREGGDRSG